MEGSARGKRWKRLVVLARVLLACLLAAQATAAFALAVYFLAIAWVGSTQANTGSTSWPYFALVFGIEGAALFGGVGVLLSLLLRRHVRSGGAERALAVVEVAMVAVSLTLAETSPWTLPVRATALSILVLAVISAAGPVRQPVRPSRRRVTIQESPRAYRAPLW